jgi:2-aminoadipate transaminase
MRLNFSGVDEGNIREGIRRLGEVVREQVDLYGTLTGGTAPGGRGRASEAAPEPRRASPRPPASDDAPLAEEPPANVLHLPRKRA